MTRLFSNEIQGLSEELSSLTALCLFCTSATFLRGWAVHWCKRRLPNEVLVWFSIENRVFFSFLFSYRYTTTIVNLCVLIMQQSKERHTMFWNTSRFSRVLLLSRIHWLPMENCSRLLQSVISVIWIRWHSYVTLSVSTLAVIWTHWGGGWEHPDMTRNTWVSQWSSRVLRLEIG